MIFIWTKQFLIATGFFAIVFLGQSGKMVIEEKRIAEKVLGNAPRTVSSEMERKFQLHRSGSF